MKIKNAFDINHSVHVIELEDFRKNIGVFVLHILLIFAEKRYQVFQLFQLIYSNSVQWAYFPVPIPLRFGESIEI